MNSVSSFRQTSARKFPTPDKNNFSKVGTLNKFELAKMDSIIERPITEPTMKGIKDILNSKLRASTAISTSSSDYEILKAKLLQKSMEVLAKRARMNSPGFEFLLWNARRDAIAFEAAKQSKSSVPTQAPGTNVNPTAVKATKTASDEEDEEENTVKRHLKLKSIIENHFVEYSKTLKNTTTNTLGKASFARKSGDKDQLDKETFEYQELQEQLEGTHAFTGNLRAKKSKALFQPEVYYTKTLDSSKFTIGPSKSSLKKVEKILKSINSVPSTPTNKSRLITKERKFSQMQQDEKLLPKKVREHTKKKRALMKAALETYDPDFPTYEVLRDINETSFEDDLNHSEATAEAMNLLYGSLTNKIKPPDKGPTTTLHVSKLPSPTDAEILQNSALFRPLDIFKGSIMGSVIREMEMEEENAKPPRQFSSRFTPNTSDLSIYRPIRKESNEKLEALRLIENFRISKRRGPKPFPGFALTPSIYIRGGNGKDSGPKQSILNKEPTSSTPKNIRRRKGSAKSKSSNGRGRTPSVRFASSFVTKNNESLSSLKPNVGSEIGANLKPSTQTNVSVSKSQKREDLSIQTVYHKAKRDKTKAKSDLEALKSKLEKIRENVKLGKINWFS